MGRKKQSKRKKYFVDRSVQGTLLLHIVAHWAVFLFAAGLFVLFVELLAGNPRDVGKNFLHRSGPTLLALLALAPLFLRDLCKLSHRFAGPMVRLRRAMRDLADGREVSPIHFRENDFWKDVASDFNRVVKRVQSTGANLDEDAIPVESNVGDEAGQLETIEST